MVFVFLRNKPKDSPSERWLQMAFPVRIFIPFKLQFYNLSTCNPGRKRILGLLSPSFQPEEGLFCEAPGLLTKDSELVLTASPSKDWKASCARRTSHRAEGVGKVPCVTLPLWSFSPFVNSCISGRWCSIYLLPCSFILRYQVLLHFWLFKKKLTYIKGTDLMSFLYIALKAY